MKFEKTAKWVNLEYYRKDLVGKERCLIALSNYINGKIGLDLLLESYRIISLESYANQNAHYLNEYLILAGLGSMCE